MSSVSLMAAARAASSAAQPAPHQLARGVRGSSAASSNRFGTLKPARRSAQWPRSSSASRSAPSSSDDDRGDRLLPLGVGAADDGRVGDGRVAQQHLLDLGRDDVLAAGDDQVVVPALDLEEALLVDPAEVAGVQPAVLVGAAGATVGPWTRISPSSMRTWSSAAAGPPSRAGAGPPRGRGC